MKDEIEFTLKSTLTEKQIDLITDAEFEHTDRIWFNTPKGKHIEFVKAQQWIPVTSRPMDVEERLEWSEKTGYDIEDSEALIYTSQLPDDGEEVLTCDRYGNVRIDIFVNDTDYGCYFEENGDMDGIVAWMPLPEPYKAESEEEHESCD